MDIFHSTSQHKNILRNALSLIIVTNTSLYIYGFFINQASPNNPFAVYLIALAFLVIHLPLLYDLVNLIRKKPLSIFGSYLTMSSLWLTAVALPIITITAAFFDLRYLPGAFLIMGLGAGAEAIIIVSSYGMALLFWIQVFFWFFLSPRLILPIVQTRTIHQKLAILIHPDLRDNPKLIIPFIVIAGIYILTALITQMALTIWLVPPNSAFWDSWIFN